MRDMTILKAVTLHAGAPNGNPDVVAWRAQGELYAAPTREAEGLVRDGVAEQPSLTGRLAALAEAVLGAQTGTEAAERGLGHAQVWAAVRDQSGAWVPASAEGMGPGRTAQDARFGSADEVQAHFNRHPNATPMFSIPTEHGFSESFIWNKGGLRKMARMARMQ